MNKPKPLLRSDEVEVSRLMLDIYNLITEAIYDKKYGDKVDILLRLVEKIKEVYYLEYE